MRTRVRVLRVCAVWVSARARVRACMRHARAACGRCGTHAVTLSLLSLLLLLLVTLYCCGGRNDS
jgi:hypothetical protein